MTTKIKMVRVTAKKRGTIIAKTGNYHFDPDGTAEAKSRDVPVDVAAEAQRKGLVSLGAKSTSLSLNPAAPAVQEAALDRRSAVAEQDEGILPALLGMGGADTRDTTNFERDPNSVARHGIQQVGTTDEKELSDLQEEADEDGDLDPDDEFPEDPDSFTPPATPLVAGDANGGDGPPIDDDDGTDQHGDGTGSSEDGDPASIEQAMTEVEQNGAQGEEPKAAGTRGRRKAATA